MSEGTIKFALNLRSLLKVLSKSFVGKWADSLETLEFVVVDDEVIRAKISIRMLDVGPVEDTDLLKNLKEWNDGLSVADWILPNDGRKLLNNGYQLIFLLVPLSSLDSLKESDGKYWINSGNGGRCFIKIYGKNDGSGQGIKRKVGTQLENPHPNLRKPGNGHKQKSRH